MFSVESESKSSYRSVHTLEAGALLQNEKTVSIWKGLDSLKKILIKSTSLSMLRKGVHVTW